MTNINMLMTKLSMGREEEIENLHYLKKATIKDMKKFEEQIYNGAFRNDIPEYSYPTSSSILNF